MKKAMSIVYQGVCHHLVNYYNAEDAEDAKLHKPSEMTEFQAVVPRLSMSVICAGHPYANAIEYRIASGCDS